jgi:hypothetical protein
MIDNEPLKIKELEQVLAKKPIAYLVTFSNGRIARKDPRLSAAIRAAADAPHARY